MLSAIKEGGIRTITYLVVFPLFLTPIFLLVAMLSKYIAILVALVILILEIRRFFKTKKDKRSGSLIIQMTVATITTIILSIWGLLITRA